MKKPLLFFFVILLIGSGFYFRTEETEGASILQVHQGGTGAITFAAGECLIGNGAGAISSAACGGSFTQAMASTTFVDRFDWTTHENYPATCGAGEYVSAIGDTLTCSIPASSGGGSGTVTTSSIPTIGNLSYWTDVGFPSKLGSVATTSLTTGLALSLSQAISVIGSAPSILTIATSSLGLTTDDIAEGTKLYYNQSRFDTAFGLKNFDNLNDVVITGVTNNQIVSWNGANWANTDLGTLTVSGLTDLFLDNTNSDLSGYKTASRIATSSAEVTYTVNTPALGGYTALEEFATVTGTPNVSIINGGAWHFVTYASEDVLAGETNIVYDVFKRNTAGTETLLFEATSTAFTATGITQYEDDFVQGDFVVNSDDRIVVKYKAYNTIGLRAVTLYAQGTAHYTHIHTPISVSHNNLNGLQGGASGEYYHQTALEYAGTFGHSILSGDNSTTSTLAKNSIIIGQLPNFGLGKFYVNSSGNVSASGSIFAYGNVTSTGHIYPASNNAVDLGGYGYAFRNIYASSSINVGETGTTSTLRGTGTSTIYGGAQITGTSGGLRVNTLTSCNTIDTDANGYMVCGTDAGGVNDWGRFSATYGATKSLMTSSTYAVWFDGAVYASSTLITSGAVTLGDDIKDVITINGRLTTLNVSDGTTATSSLGKDFLVIASTTAARTGVFYVDSSGNISASGTIQTSKLTSGMSSSTYLNGSYFLFGVGTSTFKGTANGLTGGGGSFWIDQAGDVSASGTLKHYGLSTLTGLISTASSSFASSLNISANLGLSTSTPWAKLSVATGTILNTEYMPSTSTSKTILWTDGTQQLQKIGTAAVTFAFSNYAVGQTLRLIVCNPDSGTAGAITWPANIRWAGGTAPTQTTSAQHCDVWSFIDTQATSTASKADFIFGAQTANF